MYTITLGYKSDGLTVTKLQTSRLFKFKRFNRVKSDEVMEQTKIIWNIRLCSHWSHLRLLLVLGYFPFSFVLTKQTNKQTNYDLLGETRLFTWPLKKIFFRDLRNSWVGFAVGIGLLSACTVKWCPMNFAVFDCIWTERAALYTSQFMLVLLISSHIINKYW